MRLAIFSLILLTASTLNAALISSAQCRLTAGAGGPVLAQDNGPSGCSVSGPPGALTPGFQSASITPSGQFGIAISALGGFGQLDASTVVRPDFLISGTREEIVTTDGPVRSGFAFITFGFASGDSDGFGQTLQSFGDYSYFTNIAPPNQGCGGSLLPPPCSGLLPILLGVNIPTKMQFQLSGSAIGTGAAGTLNVTFQLFEADGTTPVAWSVASAVPEPATYALCALGLGLLAASKAKRARR